MPRVIAIHENPEWFPPFARAFAAEGVEVEEWLLTDGILDLTSAPPEDAIFWSRISASAHTREHGLSKDYTRAVLSWLEAHGRRVVNGRRVIELEMSKIDQYTALAAHGVDVPLTLAAIGREQIAEAAQRLAGRLPAGAPLILKHNQGGKGLGVRKIESESELDAYLDGPEFEDSPDGITLVQEYLQPTQPRITRLEFVAGELVYAIQADTEHGGFELCPADACALDPETGRPMLPPGATAAPEPGESIFALREDPDLHLAEQLQGFLTAQGIEVAGVEYIETVDGRHVVYDVNTNTNYNAEVEAVAPASAPRELARHLKRVLAAEESRSRSDLAA